MSRTKGVFVKQRKADKKPSVESKELAFVSFDTEDNSCELQMARPDADSWPEKRVTQLAALSDNGRSFYGACNDYKESRECVAKFKSWLGHWQNVICYAHNLQYDLGNLFGDELDEIEIRMVGTRLISAKWRHVTFMDSMNIWPMALKQVGKAFNLEKFAFDSSSKKYVFRDVEIVRRAMRFARDMAAEFGAELPATLGGTAINIWKSMGGSNWHDCTVMSRDAYFGGRVELFSPGGTGRILYTDINSLYPFVMTQPFPDDLVTMNDVDGHGVARVTIKIPPQFIAPLPVRMDDGGIMYPCGKIAPKKYEVETDGREHQTGVWTCAEIREAVQHHGAKIVKVHEVFGSDRADYYYRDFVTKIYAKRKVEKDPARKLMLKLLMNNLYGQLGMSGIITRSLNRDKPTPHKVLSCYGKKVLAEMKMPLKAHVNYLHAAHVTSFARLELLKYLRMLADELIYCDTDSVIFWCKDEPPFPIGTELGQMKLEGEADKVEIIFPKTYHLSGFDTGEGEAMEVWKAKGVRKDLAQQFIETGAVSFSQPNKLREAVRFYDRNNSRKLSVWKRVDKKVVSGYKRKVRKGDKFFPKTLDIKGG